jgi:hypothetical protein
LSPVLPVTERKPQANVIAGKCKRGKGLLQQEFTGTSRYGQGRVNGELQAQRRDGRWAGIRQELPAANSLVIFADRVRR